MQVATYAERPDLVERLDEVPDVWPEFMHHSAIANRYWARMRLDHPELQLILYDDEADLVVGKGQTVPAVWDGSIETLPGGVDDALDTWFGQEHGPATALSAVVATMAPAYQGRGLSRMIIEGMRDVASSLGAVDLIAPVRPSLKSRYPLTPMERYVEWRRDDGLLFDPWLRVHERLGAETLAVCPSSMTITGTVDEWETWAGMAFPESGTYVVPGALVPVEIDREADVARYVEPNVWMRHPARS